RDARALAVAKMNLEAYVTRCDFVYDNYCHIDEILARHGIRAADRILFDLGLSSFQLNDPSRGFSFRAEGPLDMRMDQESYISAFDLVNSLSQEEISLILKDFGEERWHRRIARSIVERRSHKPIETTKELSDIVLRAMPHHAGREKIHPATRTFQALRIAVNRELEALEEALGKCGAVLAAGGRIGVISFHSLEDRIVKQKFRDWARAGKFRLITKKPLRPSECEAKSNPRARSARLRIAERI
ncbi:MAG TPA: 16S rRNA (cytosine(1402)-N(4))-methyltransferase RsmH, partial [Candidatus Omnitrophota bacterium]|nr:16S rRNA (cytosine(1402)-N(4))-methyltransferase RsmH [Candidatus Omnitrophota bacterium]